MLDDVSFTVPQGQSVAILGYNGVGKTTLFKLITGLLRPRSGRCVINGMLVPSMRDVFLMTEHANLISAMSVRDNIRFRGLLFDPDGMGGMDPSRLGGEPLCGRSNWARSSIRGCLGCPAACAACRSGGGHAVRPSRHHAG
ncbi:MAG: ATP-binding cassette domain-containing protein [Bifidobacterium dentium]